MPRQRQTLILSICTDEEGKSTPCLFYYFPSWSQAFLFNFGRNAMRIKTSFEQHYGIKTWPLIDNYSNHKKCNFLAIKIACSENFLTLL